MVLFCLYTYIDQRNDVGILIGWIISVVYKSIDNRRLLLAIRGAHNPNLQVVITQASHVCSQYSFRLLLRMNGMRKTQFDHARFDLLPLVI